MGKNLKFQSGNTIIEIPSALNDTFQKVVDHLLPESKDMIGEIIDQIREEAKKDWPIRRTKDGHYSKRSKRSRDKIYSQMYITPDFKIVAKLGNDADYAWAIRVGVRTPTMMPYKTRVASKLLWQPLRNRTDRIANALARDTLKLTKK